MTYTDTFLIEVGIAALLALSFYLPMATGLLSMAQIGFMAIGAYASALLVQAGWPFAAAVLAALIISLPFGALIATVGVRLHGFGLAIVTIGFGEIVRLVLNGMSFTGGAIGVVGIPLHTNVALVYGPLVALVLFLHRFELGHGGRALASIRTDVDAADALGINTLKVKWLMIALPAPIAAYAGVMYAFSLGFIEPRAFGFGLLVEVATAVVLGGMTTVWGAIAGGGFIKVMPNLFRWLEQWRLVAYAILMAVVLIARPQGLVTRNFVMRFAQFLRGIRRKLSSDDVVQTSDLETDNERAAEAVDVPE